MDFRDFLIQKGYAKSTINTYCNSVRPFDTFLKTHNLERSEETLNQYLETAQNIRYRRTLSHALRLHFEYLGKPLKSATPEIVPLTDEEAKKVLNNQKNLKYKTMITLLYETGLHVRTIRTSKVKDFDFKNNLLFEDVKLTAETSKLVQEYLDSYNPKEFIFEGTYGPISTSLFQTALSNSFIASGIQKKPSLTMFRKK